MFLLSVASDEFVVFLLSVASDGFVVFLLSVASDGFCCVRWVNRCLCECCFCLNTSIGHLSMHID